MARKEVGGDMPRGNSERRGQEIGGGRTDSSDRKDWLPKGCLSFSALSCYSQCKRKFWHRYINHTKKDPDAQWDPIRMTIGKCFHQILEDTCHAPTFAEDWPTTIGMKYRRKYQLSPFEMAKIVAMLIRYAEFHRASELIPIADECMVYDETIGGFIDSVMVDPRRMEWWIVDNKSAAGMRPGLKESIRRNLQLSIYAGLRDKLAKIIAESAYPHATFAGVIYRCSVKPGIKYNTKVDQDFWATVQRCTTETYEIRVPFEKMEIDTIFSEVKDTCREINLHKSLKNMRMPRNLENCLAYGSNCDYWSQCYGETATDCRTGADVRSAKKVAASEEFDDLC